MPLRSISRRVPLLVTSLAVLLSGAMWFASVGVHHVWPLAWLAPLPLLVVLPDLQSGRAALAACGGSALGALKLVLAYRGLPPVLLGGVVLLIAGPFTLVALAWRAIAQRTHPAIAITAYPALVVSDVPGPRPRAGLPAGRRDRPGRGCPYPLGRRNLQGSGE